MVINFVSESAKVGKNVKIWHFAYVGDDVEIGDNVKIGSPTVHLDYGAKVGEGTKNRGKRSTSRNLTTHRKERLHRPLCNNDQRPISDV